MRVPRRYLAVVVVAVVAVLAGILGPVALGALANPSAKDLIATARRRTLFPDAAVAPPRPAGVPARPPARTR